MRLTVADRPGVLSELASVVAEQGISIETVRQTAGPDGKAGLIIVTYLARQASLDAILTDLRNLEAVEEIISVMRVEGN